MRKYLTTLFLMLICVVYITAQEITVTGKVTDAETGEALPGVNIVIVGTTQGTTTDANGKFELKVPSANSILEFSYLGYNVERINVEGRKSIDVVLIPELKRLDEIVVVGYGTMKRSDVTGAISSISEQEIAKAKAANALDAIQGKVSGVDMTRSSGRAGSGFNILIRGARSLTASNSPIYIVDGVDYGSNININPNDIASIEILKDAASTAIYGSRGANGVILITTKKGKEGKSTVSFNTYYGITKPLGKIEMGDREYYLRMIRDLLRSDGIYSWDTPDDSIDVTKRLSTSEIEGYLNGTDFDWIDAQMKDHGSQQDYHLSFSGGTENNSYSISLNHFVEDNFIPNDNYKRYSLKGNYDSKVSKKINVGVSTFLSYTKQNLGVGINYNHVPLVTPYDENGNLKYYPNSRINFVNPLVEQDPDYRRQERYQTNIFTNFYGSLTLIKGLTLKSSFTSDLLFSRDGTYNGTFPGVTTVATASVSLINRYNLTWTNILSYDNYFNNDHHIALTAVHEMIYRRTESPNMESKDLAVPEFLWYTMGNAGEIKINYPLVESKLLSFVGRFHYGYKEKYLFTLTGRFDGASQLYDKWDFFPSASAAWRVNKENFMQNIYFISNLKLRFGYGISGNQSVSPYARLGSITPYSLYYEFGEPENVIFGYRTGKIETFPKWEKTKTVNLGIDFGIFQDRISGSMEFYHSHTYDILQTVTLPPTSAVTNVIENIGETKNRGFELSLNTVNIKTKDLRWTTDITFSTNHEEIVFLANNVKQDIANKWFVGHPIDVWYDYKFDGIWQLDEAKIAQKYGKKPGDIKRKDIVLDSIINDQDRIVLGTPRPKWTGGLNSVFTFRNFDLSIFVYARIGQMINDDVNGMWSPDARENSVKRDYWTPNNPSNKWPRVNSQLTRSGWSEATVLNYVDGSFVKIKDITLGYSLPVKIVNKMFLSSARFYITAKNAFVFGKYFSQGRYDPEGQGNISFPIPKLFAIGANIKF